MATLTLRSASYTFPASSVSIALWTQAATATYSNPATWTEMTDVWSAYTLSWDSYADPHVLLTGTTYGTHQATPGRLLLGLGGVEQISGVYLPQISGLTSPGYVQEVIYPKRTTTAVGTDTKALLTGTTYGVYLDTGTYRFATVDTRQGVQSAQWESDGSTSVSLVGKLDKFASVEADGSTTVSVNGSAGKLASFEADGSTAVSLNGSAGKLASFEADGTTNVSLVGLRTVFGQFEADGSTSVSLNGTITKHATLQSDGSTSVSFTGVVGTGSGGGTGEFGIDHVDPPFSYHIEGEELVDLVIQVYGSGFSPTDTVTWTASPTVPLDTTFVSDTQLTATIPGGNLGETKPAQIAVLTADDVISNSIAFQVLSVALKRGMARMLDISMGHPPFPPRPTEEGSPNVNVNLRPAHRFGDMWLPHPHIGTTMTGSHTVFINGRPAARQFDLIACPLGPLDVIATASINVFAG